MKSIGSACVSSLWWILGNSNFSKTTPPPSQIFCPKIFKISQVVSQKPDKTPVDMFRLIDRYANPSNIYQTSKSHVQIFIAKIKYLCVPIQSTSVYL